MAKSFKIKKQGRPSVEYKIRSIKGLTPKGFKLDKISVAKKLIVFKKKKE